MRLTDLLQLTNDLNMQTTFYLKIDHQLKPWSKLSLENDQGLLYPGSKAMTKKKLFRLVGKMHNRGLPLRIVSHQHKYPFFGLQIVATRNRVILM